jgi:hypothetical protein
LIHRVSVRPYLAALKLELNGKWRHVTRTAGRSDDLGATVRVVGAGHVFANLFFRMKTWNFWTRGPVCCWYSYKLLCVACWVSVWRVLWNAVRVMVVFPILAITVMVLVGKHYVQKLISRPRPDAVAVKEKSVPLSCLTLCCPAAYRPPLPLPITHPQRYGTGACETCHVDRTVVAVAMLWPTKVLSL